MNEKEMLFRKINALDFSMWELHIFLDTHPCDAEAIRKHDDLCRRRAVLVQQYEQKFGPLGITCENGDRWEWVDSPWPWDPDFSKEVK